MTNKDIENRKPFTVKIIIGSGWYEDNVGSLFTVLRWSNDYVVKSDYDQGFAYPWRHINPSDTSTLDEVMRNDN